MVSDLQHVLESVGLNDREAKLYLAGLQLGSAPASEYARKSKLNRITTYNALENLAHRGYFTIEKRSQGKWYAPVAPEYLSVEVRKNAEAVERMLPELRSLQGKHYRKPHVRFYNGWEGVKRVYDDTLTAQGEILNFANSSVVRTYWPSYDEDYVMERVRRGIQLRGIAPDDATGKSVRGKDRESLREIRLVPAKDFDFRNEINIYDHKVAISSFAPEKSGDSDVFAVIIESKEVAETQKQIFEMAWRYAENKRK